MRPLNDESIDKFKQCHPDTDCCVCLEHAEKLGLGAREYELIKV